MIVDDRNGWGTGIGSGWKLDAHAHDKVRSQAATLSRRVLDIRFCPELMASDKRERSQM